MHGKNINFLYSYEINFYHVTIVSINFGTLTAQSLLNHLWHLQVFEIKKEPLTTR